MASNTSFLQDSEVIFNLGNSPAQFYGMDLNRIRTAFYC